MDLSFLSQCTDKRVTIYIKNPVRYALMTWYKLGANRASMNTWNTFLEYHWLTL